MENMESMWERFGNELNNSFFFVIDKITDLQSFFMREAMSIGSVVFLIAVLSAALNYALTGTGLKENIVKILKATVFFFIVFFTYPQIIGFITSWTFKMAEQSIYPSVNDYFNETVEKVEINTTREVISYGMRAKKVTTKTINEILRDNLNLFNNLSVTYNNYSVISPAEVLKIIFLIAKECFEFSDDKNNNIIPEMSRVIKGIGCAALLVFTGCFALLEYIVCFLEFMLVSSVGIILFPLSIWEGSKFMAEKFIGALVGFFIKMLFCNIAIFLMIYGFVTIFYVLADNFSGTVDQIIFIVFSSLLFFYICKSAPGIAQSLLTGTPSLSAAGAISAATGAVAAAGATMGLAQKAGKAAGGMGGMVAGGIAKTGLGVAGSLIEAKAASDAAKTLGGDRRDQARAFFGSIGSDVKDTFKAGGLGLTRSLLGGDNTNNPHSWNAAFRDSSKTFSEHFQERKREGATRGTESME